MIPDVRCRRLITAAWTAAVFGVGLAACGVQQAVDPSSTASASSVIIAEDTRGNKSESAVPRSIDSSSVAPSRVSTRENAPGTGPESAATRTGALFGESQSLSCAEGYSPTAVAGRSFAFDGTITAIGAAVSNQPGGDDLDVAGVTFQVNEWFRGDSGEVVTVDLYKSNSTIGSVDLPTPAYEIGTRLLVSGEPRWGGAPLDSPIAWPCGFTRYFDTETAADWAAAAQ